MRTMYTWCTLISKYTHSSHIFRGNAKCVFPLSLSLCTWLAGLPLKLVVLLLGERMVGGPYHSPRVDVEELAPRARPTLFVALASLKCRRVRTQGGGNRPMLANRNQRQAAEDRLSWHNVDDRLRACVVHLFRSCKRHAAPPRRHPAANHGQALYAHEAINTYLVRTSSSSCICFTRTVHTCANQAHSMHIGVAVCTVCTVCIKCAQCTLNVLYVHT